MRAIEGSTIPASPRYERPFQPPLTIVQPEPHRTGAAERWFAAAMFGSMLLFVIALAKFVIDPAVQTVSQPNSTWTTQGP